MNPLSFNMFLNCIRFRTTWDVSDYSISSSNKYRGLDLHFRSINYFFNKWSWTTKHRRYLFLVSLSLQQKTYFSNRERLRKISSSTKFTNTFFDLMCDQYVKFCTFTLITNLHIFKHISMLFDYLPKRHGTNDINELRNIFLITFAKGMSVVCGNLFRWELRAVSKKNITSTWYWWRWIQNRARLHRLCRRRSDDIMVSSVRALEHSRT